MATRNVMVFKQDWEMVNPDFNVSKEVIGLILEQVYQTHHLEYEVTKQGCANKNLVVMTPRGQKEVVRLYCRDPGSLKIEQSVLAELNGSVPVPTILKTGRIADVTYCVQNHLPGVLLRDLLLAQEVDVYGLMENVGHVLGLLSKWRFGKSGFFDDGLTIQSDGLDYVSYTHKLLDQVKSENKLTAKECQNWHQIVDALSQHFPNPSEDYLVHGDFDPSNILVDCVDQRWSVTGILDWEFAHSGSPLQDMANMLRYQDKVSKDFRKGFIQGVQHQISLPDHWETTVDLCNVLGLLDCLAHRVEVKSHPNRYHDVTDLLSHLYIKLQRRC